MKDKTLYHASCEENPIRAEAFIDMVKLTDINDGESVYLDVRQAAQLRKWLKRYVKEHSDV